MTLKCVAQQALLIPQQVYSVTLGLKAQPSLPGQLRSKWEGAMIKLSGLSVSYTQHTSLTVLYVNCYQLVTRNSNNSVWFSLQQRVHNPACTN